MVKKIAYHYHVLILVQSMRGFDGKLSIQTLGFPLVVYLNYNLWLPYLNHTKSFCPCHCFYVSCFVIVVQECYCIVGHYGAGVTG